MWIGVLTEGPHPCRPNGQQRSATLFVWGPRERARIDGPPAAIVPGIRSLVRDASRSVGPVQDPRCFACREPYPLPLPDLIRARADVGDMADDGQRGYGEDTRGDGSADGPVASGDGAEGEPPGAVLLLVHLDGTTAAGHEGEALVVVAGTRLALLVPFEALAVVAAELRAAFGHDPTPCCARCGGLVPGGTLTAPNRASRRRSSGRASNGRRAA